jgi:hypothetical protein
VELYLHPLIGLHGVVLKLSTGPPLPLPNIQHGIKFSFFAKDGKLSYSLSQLGALKTILDLWEE